MGVVGFSAASASGTRWHIFQRAVPNFQMTQSITFTSTPPRRRRSGHLHPHGDGRGERQPGHLHDRRLGTRKLPSRVRPSPSSLSAPASSTPTRPATPAMGRAPRSSSPSPCNGSPEHHLHLDRRPRPVSAAPTPRRRPAGRAGNPVTFTIDAVGARQLHASGCDRHLRRRRDLHHRRQPGRQRQLRAATQVQQSFAVDRHPDASPSPRPRPPPRWSAAPTPRRRRGGGERQPGHLRDRLLGARQLHLPAAPSPSSPSGPASSTPTRPATPPTARHPGPAVLPVAKVPRPSPSPRRPPGATVVGGTYTPTATGRLERQPSPSRSTPRRRGICTSRVRTVTFIAAGTCVIDANQAGNANYSAATQVQQSFTVAKGAQTITFTSSAPTGAVVGGTYTPTATGGGSRQPGHLHRSTAPRRRSAPSGPAW